MWGPVRGVGVIGGEWIYVCLGECRVLVGVWMSVGAPHTLNGTYVPYSQVRDWGAPWLG